MLSPVHTHINAITWVAFHFERLDVVTLIMGEMLCPLVNKLIWILT